MKVMDYLDNYYNTKPFFGKGGGMQADNVKVYLGPFDLYVPNLDQRKRLIPYHDLHHIVSGYNNSRIGEGEVSAWELGTGCLSKPLAAFYDLTGFATGLMYSPKRVYEAFIRGRKSSNFYGIPLETMMTKEMATLSEFSQNSRNIDSKILNNSLFLAYCFGAVAISITFIPVYILNRVSIKIGITKVST